MGKRPAPQSYTLAEGRVGYLGKKTNAQLDDLKANAGGRFNRPARGLDALGAFHNGKKNRYAQVQNTVSENGK